MFALNRRRDFVHKLRAQHDSHPALAARASPALSAQDVPVAASPSANPKATTPANLPPVTPDTKTSDAPSSTPSPSLPAQSAASASHSSSSSSSSSAASAFSSGSSLTTSSATSTVSTPLTAATQATPHVPSVSTQVVGVSYTPSYPMSSSLSPSTTSSPSSSSGTNTGAIVGGVAGTLAGIAVLGLLLMWCMRRQKDRDIDDFDAQAFKRQSAVLLDDPLEPSRSYNPRPPTMIERHNASPALAAQVGHGGQNFYGSFGGYGQQPPYPSEMIQPAVSPPPQAYGAPPMGYAGYHDPQPQLIRQPSTMGHAAYDAQQQLARQPSDMGYLTRQTSSAAGYVPAAAPPPGSLDPNAQYIDLDRSSISPYQAAQYADISRQLGATNANADVPSRPLELPEDPLPCPFDDPVSHQDYPSVSVATAAAPQTQKNVTELERPATVYEEGDAYGGI